MAYWIAKYFLPHYQIVQFSNIAIAIVDFSLLLPIYLLLFQLSDRKDVTLSLFASCFVSGSYIETWLLSFIDLSILIALPTIAIAIVVAVLKAIAKSE